MEIQLQELIDQIKKDGVASAEAEAAAILKAARDEADVILSKARADADQMVQDARAACKREAAAGEDAIRQAGRNLLLSFRESVVRELTALLQSSVSAVYSSDAFAELLTRAVEGWARQPDAAGLQVVLNQADLDRLQSTVLAGLKERMGGGVTFRASDRFDGGFRVGVGDGGVYYDFSAEAVVDMLSAYLDPKVTALLPAAE